ncbi:hypothetical protein JL721_5268 [Aureococcus anophagefferens]|nr:hypothetical protein JL721_5268 [Aureococcus anophagefferens]
MTATASNLPELAAWLRASLFRTSYRPTTLDVFVASPPLYAPGGECRELIREPWTPTLRRWDGAQLADVAAGWAVEARMVDERRFANTDEALGAELCLAARGFTLRACVRRGVAFHHAELTSLERDVVEGAIRDRLLRCCVATTTLSVGVNTPAARVVVLQLSAWCKAAELRQMCGRAGRKGFGDRGEAFVVCGVKASADRCAGLLAEDYAAIKSALAGDASLAPREADERRRVREKHYLDLVCSGAAKEGAAADVAFGFGADVLEAATLATLADLRFLRAAAGGGHEATPWAGPRTPRGSRRATRARRVGSELPGRPFAERMGAACGGTNREDHVAPPKVSPGDVESYLADAAGLCRRLKTFCEGPALGPAGVCRRVHAREARARRAGRAHGAHARVAAGQPDGARASTAAGGRRGPRGADAGAVAEILCRGAAFEEGADADDAARGSRAPSSRAAPSPLSAADDASDDDGDGGDSDEDSLPDPDLVVASEDDE